MDAGAQSPKESWLRMILVMAGIPRPQTQIPVPDECGVVFAHLDMGWEEVKVAAEYDASTTELTANSTDGINGAGRGWSVRAGS